MLSLTQTQLRGVDAAAVVRHVEVIEDILARLNMPSFAGLSPNDQRSLVLKAVRRAHAYGAQSMAHSVMVAMFMLTQGTSFDLTPPAEGGSFGDPTVVDAQVLASAFETLLDRLSLREALESALPQARPDQAPVKA